MYSSWSNKGSYKEVEAKLITIYMLVFAGVICWFFKKIIIHWFSQKPKHSSYTVVNDKEKQLILKLKNMEPANVWYFCLKSD